MTYISVGPDRMRFTRHTSLVNEPVQGGGQGILELDNFRANFELYIYRMFIFFGNNTFFWENEVLHIKNNSSLKYKSKNG